MQDIFIGRQPIFDRDMRVIAYELLYRSGEENRAGPLDGDRATSQVILDTFTEVGLEDIAGRHPVFINLTRNFIVNPDPLPFPADKVVLEVLEDIQVDDDLIAALRNLSSQGYRIALDDFIFHEDLRPLVELADIIKIDVRALDRATAAEHVPLLGRSRVKLLAEKVESQEEYTYYKELGFDYFQGYFLCRPNIVKGQRMPANRLAILRLLAELQNPDVEVKDLDTLISQDVGLSYKLLRYINSAFFALPRKIDSIQQAVVYLGNQAIKTWATMVALVNIDDKPHELMATALVRAKFCERLAALADKPNQATYFTTGLFSALDALMDQPMAQVLESLPLSGEITAALLAQQGEPGAALGCVLAYERGDWDLVRWTSLDHGHITTAYLESIRWADQTFSALG